MPHRGAFIVPVHDLDLSGRSVHFPITPVWLRGALEGCEPQPAGSTGQMDVHLTKTGNEVLVQGQIDTALVIPCARCLEPVEFRPHIELSLLLHPAAGALVPPRRVAQMAGDDETEFGDEDADNDTYAGDEVVLDRFVREAILLESPTFPLCSEACEGIRPASDSVPGSEGAGTDPRLLPLLELAKRRKLKE